MADYDPLTISDGDLKALSPSDRAKVYKARAAAKREGWVPPPPGAAAPGQPSGAAVGAPVPAAPAAPAPATPAAAATGAAPTDSGATAGAAATGAAATDSGATPGAAATGAAPTVAAADSGAAPGTAATRAAPTGVAAPGTAATGGAAAAAPAGAAAAARPAPAAPAQPEAPKEPAFVQRVLELIPGSTWQWRHGYAEMKVPSERLLDAALSLRAAGFDYLSFITEVDWQDRLELVYNIFSYDYRSQPLGAILRADLPRDGMPSIASVTSVWPGAEFMEREAFEMMGIRFLGHPDLRRILLPDDFVGFPMRRDYETDFDYITVKQLVHESD